MKKLVFLCVLSALAVSGATSRAVALTQFKKAFQEKYVDVSSSAELKEAFKKANCNTCHIKGAKTKDERNAYGQELAKLIEGDANKRIKDAGETGRKAETEKILAELQKAFEEVANIKTESGETYGDRIKAGKLPVEQ
jgi:hypothetical protein